MSGCPARFPSSLARTTRSADFWGSGQSERDRIFGDVSGTYEMLGSFSRGRAPTAVCTPAELGCAFSRDTHSHQRRGHRRQVHLLVPERNLAGRREPVPPRWRSRSAFDASSRVAFLMSNDKTSCALTGFDTSMPNHAVYQAIIEGIT